MAPKFVQITLLVTTKVLLPSLHCIMPGLMSVVSTSQLSHEKRALGWLGYIGDDILPSSIGITRNHYKDPDPYQPTSIMESKGPRVFWAVAQKNQRICSKVPELPNSNFHIGRIARCIDTSDSLHRNP